MPKSYKISEDQALELEMARKSITDKRIDKRLHALQLRGKGMKNPEIAEKGHSIGSGQIYRVLERQGWRAVMPRSKHPKAADEATQEASRKSTGFAGRFQRVKEPLVVKHGKG